MFITEQRLKVWLEFDSAPGIPPFPVVNCLNGLVITNGLNRRHVHNYRTQYIDNKNDSHTIRYSKI